MKGNKEMERVVEKTRSELVKVGTKVTEFLNFFC